MGGPALQAAVARLNSPVLDLLACLLAYNPDERMTAAQALAHPWFQQVMNVLATARSLLSRWCLISMHASDGP